ncbi:MAG: anion permease [Clostridiales bacterium]|nr:anion permease [Clostridiales bacterium]
MKNLSKNDRKRLIGWILCAVILIAALMIRMPETSGLTTLGIRALMMFLFLLVAMITNAFGGVMFACIMTLISLSFCGVLEMKDIFSGFSASMTFLAFGIVMLSIAMDRTSVPKRLTILAIKLSRNNPRMLIFWFMLLTALVSAVLNNFAATACFAAAGLGIIKSQGDPEPGTSNFAKCVMIGVPLSAQFGGMITPAGSTLNPLAMSLYESATGVTLTFVDWIKVAGPVGLVLTIVCYFVLTFLSFPPESLQPISTEEMPDMDFKEKYTCAVMLFMVVGWVAGTWIPVLTMQMVSMVGSVLFMFPVLGCIGWKEIRAEQSWDTVFMIGILSVVASAINGTGAMQWVVENVLVVFTTWPGIAMAIAFTAIGCALHIVLPMGSPIMSMLEMPFIMMCVAAGIPGVIGMYTATIGGCAGIVLPFDMLPVLTLDYGYYSISDFVKNGLKEFVFVCIIGGTLAFLLSGIFFPV